MARIHFFVYIFVFTVLSVFQCSAIADTLAVPEDFANIRVAIGSSEDGDVVLVWPGVYRENIDFGGKEITVASLFLTTGDETYIDSTIIDGNRNGAVVHFHNSESSDARLSGFTLINGTGYEAGGNTFGGGIHNWINSSATLDHLKITGCTATNGGGIYCQDTNHQVISHVEVSGCQATNGGGIRILRGSADLDHVCLYGNEGTNVGGGLQIVRDAIALLVSVTVVNNISARGGGIYISGYSDANTESEAELVNTIVWGNSDNNIYFSNTYDPCTMMFNFCDVEGGEDEIVTNDNAIISWGNGNMNRNPEFEDEGEGDFHLSADSPCINTGDPDSPRDPDGSRADIGAYYYLAQNSLLHGFVLDFSSDEPISGAVIHTNLGQEAHTDEEGYWNIEGAFIGRCNITACCAGFNDSTMNNQNVEVDDTLMVTFRLLHPEISPNMAELSIRALPDTTLNAIVSISNTGNGILEWTVEPRLLGDFGVEPWEFRRSLNVTEITGDNQIMGAVFCQGNFYVSGTNGEETPQIYVISQDGELLNSFDQAGQAQLGMRDLTYGNDLIWGTGERNVYGFTPQGELAATIRGPFFPNTAIAWDPVREALWICGTITDYIACFDLEGNEIAQVSRHNMNVFGLACWEEDPDGYTLYVFNSPGGGRQVVSKINPETDEIIHIRDLEPEHDGRPEGCFITTSYDPLSWVFMDVANTEEGDRIDVWQLSRSTNWLAVNPMAGLTNPGEATDLEVTINTSNLIPDNYEGELYFCHNAVDTVMHLPVLLEILNPRAVNDGNPQVPLELCLLENYPNPFNSSTQIIYSIPRASHTRINLYNQDGRKVAAILDRYSSAGMHSIAWQAEDLPSGIYYLKMNSGERQTVHKVLNLH